jgi:hypothetical protein
MASISAAVRLAARHQERLFLREQLVAKRGRWMDLWGGSAFALRLGHKMTVGRYDHAKQRFFPGLRCCTARGKGLRTTFDAL